VRSRHVREWSSGLWSTGPSRRSCLVCHSEDPVARLQPAVVGCPVHAAVFIMNTASQLGMADQHDSLFSLMHKGPHLLCRLALLPRAHNMITPAPAARAGICGSDLHLYLGTIPNMKPGQVMGHEVRALPALPRLLLAPCSQMASRHCFLTEPQTTLHCDCAVASGLSSMQAVSASLRQLQCVSARTCMPITVHAGCQEHLCASSVGVCMHLSVLIHDGICAVHGDGDGGGRRRQEHRAGRPRGGRLRHRLRPLLPVQEGAAHGPALP